jgi:hypothetical protein
VTWTGWCYRHGSAPLVVSTAQPPCPRCSRLTAPAAGFIANPADMPGGWIGAFYSNPLAWFIKGTLINEMTSPDWSNPSADNPDITIGEEALINRCVPVRPARPAYSPAGRRALIDRCTKCGLLSLPTALRCVHSSPTGSVPLHTHLAGHLDEV